MIVERKKTFRQKTGHLNIKYYKFKGDESFKYLGVILHEDNNHHIYLQEKIRNANKTYFMLQKFFKNKTYLKK
jgi:hypothetical protein